MANRNVTLQPSACKENPSASQQQFYKPRQLTIRKGFRLSKSLYSNRPAQLEPYIVLRGQWFANAGFSIGQKVTVQVGHQQLIVTPSE